MFEQVWAHVSPLCSPGRAEGCGRVPGDGHDSDPSAHRRVGDVRGCLALGGADGGRSPCKDEQLADCSLDM